VDGRIVDCNATGSVVSTDRPGGGLVGFSDGLVFGCHATGNVTGNTDVGGLVGMGGIDNEIRNCWASGRVEGTSGVGGLVGSGFGRSWDRERGVILNSYSYGQVVGTLWTGGLLGNGDITVIASFWDVDESRQQRSAGGMGKTTPEMKDIRTYLEAGWDFVGEMENGAHEIWQMLEPNYPVLATPSQLRGLGTSEDPYLVHDVQDLRAMSHHNPYACYRLVASIDLSGMCWGTAVVQEFSGVFDGNGNTISHVAIRGDSNLGLFGKIGSEAQVKNLRLLNAEVVGSGDCIGALAGFNSGAVTGCDASGEVEGGSFVAGLIGKNDVPGVVANGYSTCAATGNWAVGGLVGGNGGDVNNCYSTGTVSGTSTVGGLVGRNAGEVANCHSTSTVNGGSSVGGLVGANWEYRETFDFEEDRFLHGLVARCYSTGAVRGTGEDVGDLVGQNDHNDEWWGTKGEGVVSDSFWDTQTSGQTTSDGGAGKTTAEMQTAQTFLDTGWDFVGEAENGAKDIWWILEGKDYPRLWWEQGDEALP
jgi:hypothetical protein